MKKEKKYKQRSAKKFKRSSNNPEHKVGGEKKLHRQSSEKNNENAALKISAQN